MLTLALLVAVAAPVGALPGTKHPVWQIAAAELHDIMQLETVKVCARRNFAALAPPEKASASATTPNIPTITADRRICVSSPALPKRHHSAVRGRRECGRGSRHRRRDGGRARR
ncbi:MAG TPA: hypothetical protein VMC05_16210 [Xanthobacteraceae bacterium]|nr:hypothetical protein [Xanthobacteraceae bacterium]